MQPIGNDLNRSVRGKRGSESRVLSRIGDKRPLTVLLQGFEQATGFAVYSIGLADEEYVSQETRRPHAAVLLPRTGRHRSYSPLRGQ